MPLTRVRGTEQPPPSKVAGILYILFGFLALTMAAFFAVIPDSFGVTTNYRLAICGAISVYGIFRIVSGIITVRKASAAGEKFSLIPDRAVSDRAIPKDTKPIGQ